MMGLEVSQFVYRMVVLDLQKSKNPIYTDAIDAVSSITKCISNGFALSLINVYQQMFII